MFRFQTALTHSFYDKVENLLFIRMKAEYEPTMELARVNFEQTHYYLGETRVKVILDIRNLDFEHIPREVMDYMADSPYNKYQHSVALIINGLGQKMLGNFYLTVVKPKVKTKLFNTAEGAMDWQKINNKALITSLMQETP